MTDRSDPFAEIEQLVDEFVQLPGPGQQRIPVDVIDGDDEVVVLADVPGRDAEDIDVQLEESRHLHLEAGPVGSEHEGRHVTRERSTDGVERSISLPAAVDEDATEASYDRGVLTVRLQKVTGSGDGTDIPVN